MRGEIDVYDLDNLYDCLKNRLMQGQDLTIDCQEVVQMDTLAIQLLVAFKRSFTEKQKLTLMNIPAALERAWEIMGVKQILLKE